MKKKELYCYAALCFTLSFLLAPELCSGGNIQDMKILATIDITTPRHESFPNISYNPKDKEFMVLWHTGGPMRAGCVNPFDQECTATWHSIDGRRISLDGKLLGDAIQLSPPEVVGWKDLPKSAYNVMTNEYMVVFQMSRTQSFWAQDIFIAKIDNHGNILQPFNTAGRYATANHPLIFFNRTEKEYLVAYNDKHAFLKRSDNLGFILDEDGNKLNQRPFVIGKTAGVQTNSQAVYNVRDNTYFVVWEDFRHVQTIIDSCDLYGALLDARGNMIREFPVIDDFGTPDEGSQNNQNLAYNPDQNEYLVAWGATNQPSLEEWGGVVGRIFKRDGTPKGELFVVADAVKPQNSPQMVYVQTQKKYFIVWSDYRKDTALETGMAFFNADNVDVYGRWLNPDGTPASDEIPLCTDEGKQVWPTLAASPNRLLIMWSDYNAPDDLQENAAGGIMVFDFKSNIRGVIYGTPE